MAGQKKFGFFAGVFTPSILTILGVIMYMRLGWVVGHAGLTGSLVIIIIAHVISVATGLSISSIATNKQVGAGGVYYVLSRSLGLPMGGAIGFTLFIATSFSIALYLIGFAENFNPVLGMGSTINDFRVSGTLALLLLTLLVYVSTSVAIKSQYFILGAIILSLVAIFFGDSSALNATTPVVSGLSQDVSFAVLFGIFFPAVTGFTAGIAMSGDLENPKKDIPVGTMLAIGVGLVVYLVLAVFLSVSVSEAQLQNNYNVLMDIALFAPLVIAGIWGATLSSALGGLLGGPRIFQAMSADRITPFSTLFSKGVGKSNEPRNALILTIIIAEIGVLIGELDSIARLVSMFYLMAYNFINLSFFLESWANSDFSPKFKVSKWIGAIGFLATFTVMFQIDPVAMVGAYVLLFGLYFYLKRKEMSLSSGDIWGSVWSSVVKTGLRRMDEMDEHQNYWRPNILLFSGGTDKRTHLIEFSQDLGGRNGVISNFDLIESPDAKVMFPKREKGVKNTDILSEGIFTRRQEVKDVYTGIETIASVYGFSGIEPNTVLMGWPRNTKHPGQFAQLTQSLIDLDYNVLYLDYDEERGYGKYSTIDLWWRGISNNVILTIKLVKFLLATPRWSNAQVRILLVNEDRSERKSIQESINEVLNEFRLSAEIKIINNSVEKLSVFELMKHYSNLTDLVFLGIPDKICDEEKYVANTNTLVDNIGTTLLVRASSQFSETRLGLTSKAGKAAVEDVKEVKLGELHTNFDKSLHRNFEVLEDRLFRSNQQFIQNTVSVITGSYVDLFQEIEEAFKSFYVAIEQKKSTDHFRVSFHKLQEDTLLISEGFAHSKRERLSNLIEKELNRWMSIRQTIFSKAPESIKRVLMEDDLIVYPKDNFDVKWIKRQEKMLSLVFKPMSRSVDWRSMLMYFEATVSLQNMKHLLYDLGMIEVYNLKALRERTVLVVEDLLDKITLYPEKRTVLVNESKKSTTDGLVEQMEIIERKPEQLLQLANQRDRRMILKMVELVKHLDVNSIVEELEEDQSRAAEKKIRNEIADYPVFWARNQELFNNLFKAWMVTTGLHVELIFLKEKVGRDVRGSLFGLFKRVSKHLQGLFDETAETTEESRISGYDENELLSHNPSEFLARIHEDLRDNIRNLPESVDLINEDSVLNFEDFQESEVEQISIDLQKIADYYIELDFIEPLNRRISHTYNLITSKFEELGTRISFITELVDNKSEGSPEQVIELKEKLKVEFTELNETISQVEVEFITALDKQFTELSSKLSVTDLLTSTSNPIRYIHIKQGYKGVAEKWDSTKKIVLKWLETSVFELRKKRHQLRLAEFNEQNKTLVNKRKQFRDFVELNTILEEVQGQLPTYYRHLFSGKQVFSNQMSIARPMEMDQALWAITKGDTGGVMVISEPLAGKSHFVENLIQNLNPPKVIRIVPPRQGVFKNSSLLSAFQEATNMEGNFFSIMSALPSGTVFSFNKLERWWLRQPGGGKHIDQLVWLIERYGDRHHFVMSMNIFAYDLIRQVTNLETALSTTIMIPPANNRELAEIMFERHQLAGVTIYFNDNVDVLPSKRDVMKVLEKIAAGANGNIGVTMLRWLAVIQSFDDNKVIVKPIMNYEIPSELPTKWAMLLMHLVLHDRLHSENIETIFGMQDKATIHSVIKEMQYTKLIRQVSKNTYTIERFVMKSVTDQLIAQKYLKKFE